MNKNPARLVVVLGLGLGTLAACSSSAQPAATSSPSASASSPVTHTTKEAHKASPRLLVSHPGGLLVLDAKTLEPLTELPAEEFVRLSHTGDGRHVVVSEESRFRVVDLGSWAQAHGDHAHHFTTAPVATSIAFSAKHPGHVVHHDGLMALFDDGTGTVEVLDTAALDKGMPATTKLPLGSAHHGVAVPLHDGTIVHTAGTEEARSSIVVRAKNGSTIARTDDCPGVHGETIAGHDTVSFGCTDGVMVFDGTAFTKVKTSPGYARTGTLAGSPTSPIVLGDHKTDEDATLERPTKVALINTENKTSRLVELGASYTFRSLARGPEGEALVLTTDGKLTVIDPSTGAITQRISVMAAWSEPDDWKQARPLVQVAGTRAYVTDPATQSVHVVNLRNGKVIASKKLGVAISELVANEG